MKKKETNYWFKPKRFWNWFAAYYPSSLEGWAIWIAAAAFLTYSFMKIDRASHSASDTFISFAPEAVIVFIFVDLITLLMGKYPAWWKKGR